MHALRAATGLVLGYSRVIKDALGRSVGVLEVAGDYLCGACTNKRSGTIESVHERCSSSLTVQLMNQRKTRFTGGRRKPYEKTTKRMKTTVLQLRLRHGAPSRGSKQSAAWRAS